MNNLCDVREISSKLIEELKLTSDSFSNEITGKFVNKIKTSDNLFFSAAGRSQLMIKGFAMRMMHFGFTSHIIGETVTPSITGNDLLIIASGSGETDSMVNIGVKAKKIGVYIVLITASKESRLARIADLIIYINTEHVKKQIQSKGSTFEQGLMLYCESLTIIIFQLLFNDKFENVDDLIDIRHANLE